MVSRGAGGTGLRWTVQRVVVLGDVVGSRDLEDRAAFADRVRTVVDDVNRTFADDLVAEFAMLKGIDEFVGVLSSVAPLYRVVDAIGRGVAPVEARVVAVTGEIDVSADDATGLDGPAFHEADELLGELERRDLFVDVAVDDGAFDALVAGEMNALHLLKRRWTDRQREVVEHYRETGTQTATANALGVSQQTVSDVLAAADWPRIELLETELNDALASYAARGGD